MKKRITTITLLIALFAIIGSASLAYFTDFKTDEIEATAGSIKLEHTKPTISGNNLMVPGDSFELPINFKNLGASPALVRVTILDHKENGTPSQVKFASGGTAGFVVKEKDKPQILDLALSSDNNTFTFEKEFAQNGEHTLNLTIELLPGSGNEYQNKTTKLTYIIEAIQDKNIGNWTFVTTNDIKIKAAN